MPIPQLSREIICSYANHKSWQRGEAYYNDGCVRKVCQRGQSITAEVRGNRTYGVTIDFDAGGLNSASCSCPYDWGGYCKHIIAALLFCLHEPTKISLRRSLEEILDLLNDVQTQSLLQELVAKQPDLLNEIESIADRLTPPKVIQTKANEPQREITVNVNRIRSQVKNILEDSVRHYEYGGEEDIATEEISSLIQDAQMYTQQQDYGNAIAMLTAITEACVENWDIVDEYGVDNGRVATELSEVWCETILSADLTEAETVDLQVDFAYWHDGWGSYFDLAIAALSQGWDNPTLQQVLQGNSSDLWQENQPEYANDLALIRLQILARQERFTEYLHLALAEGQISEYLTMLVQLERVSEAMQTARFVMSTMEQALVFSQSLNEQNARSQALAIAKRGLELPGSCQYDLATWASEIAEELNDRLTAVNTKVKAFQARPSFADYHRVEQLAGEHWSNIKGELLGTLATNHNWSADKTKIDIYLYEGQVERAIATIDNSAYFPNNLIHRVMDAAMTTDPDWVIERASDRAESIMDAGKAKYYADAVAWLAKARQAYLASDKKQQWLDYRTKLVTVHARKRKLMSLMKSLE